MREITADIWIWTWLSEPHGYNFNGYFIKYPGENVCVDPVEPSDDVLDFLRRETVKTIAITNRNHVRAAGRVRESCGARALLHPADAEYARAQGAATDGDLTIGVRTGPFDVVGVPGKSPGEVALHWRERGILIVGDAVIGNPPGKCSLLRDKVMDDPAQLRSSVRSLLDLDFETLLVGDGEPILRGAKDRLRELVSTW